MDKNVRIGLILAGIVLSLLLVGFVSYQSGQQAGMQYTSNSSYHDGYGFMGGMMSRYGYDGMMGGMMGHMYDWDSQRGPDAGNNAYDWGNCW